MTYFFISLLQVTLPFGLLLASAWAAYPNLVRFRPLVWLSVSGFLSGAVLFPFLPAGQTANFFRINLILCVLLAFFVCRFLASSRLNFLWQFLLSASAGMLWAKDPNTALITNTDVVNTEVILQLFAVVLAFGVSLLLSALQFMLFRQAAAQQVLKPLPTVCLIVFFFLLAVPLAGELLLAMMKLQVIDLTKGLISFVAKSGEFSRYANYFVAAWEAVVFVLFFTKVYYPRKQQIQAENEPINRRKKMALTRQSARICTWLAVCLGALFTSQLYWDKVASRPPQLSEAAPVSLSADHYVHLPLAQFKDNKLHRFAWHTEDGKLVRFFIINRLPDKFSLGVVFDACLLCGDQGYVMQGNQVVCIGCGVYMFTPSIGKKGGCNPVPIEGWQQTETEVLIGRESLEAGIPLFSDNYSKEE